MTCIVYANGRVFTADEPAWAEAIVADDGRIAFVGSDSEATAAAESWCPASSTRTPIS